MYLKVFNQHIVVLGSAETVRYLDWRSANTSDRHLTPSIALCVLCSVCSHRVLNGCAYWQRRPLVVL